MVIDPKLSQDNAFIRSTPLGVTLVHVLLAGIGAGSVATITDGRLQTTLMAMAKELIILRIVNRAKKNGQRRPIAGHGDRFASGLSLSQSARISKEFKQVWVRPALPPI